MAVFSAIDAGQLEVIAREYRLPHPLQAEGIPEGVENTNYFLRPPGDGAPQWVLTLLETAPDPVALGFTLQVIEAAAAAGLPVALPLAHRGGERRLEIQGRQVLVAPRMPGRHDATPGRAQCAAIGRFLGRLHARLGRTLPERDDPRGLDWLLATCPKLLDGPSRSEAVERALEVLHAKLPLLHSLPRTTVHGDLFRDNALFVGTRLSAVIDWHNAATAPAAWDLAIVLNDWCLDASGRLAPDRTRALLRAYSTERPLADPERQLMPELRAWAGLRFWTSRTISQIAEQQRGSTGCGQEIYRGKEPAEQEAIVSAALEGSERGVWRALTDPPGSN